MPTRFFGVTSKGDEVRTATLSGGGLRAEIISYGAAIRDLRLEGVPHPLVLGFETFGDHEQHSPFFGAIVGRYANRIAGGRFELDEKNYRLNRNENGHHHLHGGAGGFSHRVWRFDDVGKTFAELSYISADGEEGYPGRVEARCRYELKGGGILSIELTARTDLPTIVNLTTHSYFNLSGSRTIDDHLLQVAAAHYVPVDTEKLPVGGTLPVDGTRFDLRRRTALSDDCGPVAFDHNFCLTDGRREETEYAARLVGGNVELSLWTSEPGLQIYTGEGVDCPVAGLDGRKYRARAGICLEPQIWPDAPNQPGYPSPVLRPGERYCHRTECRFRTV